MTSGGRFGSTQRTAPLLIGAPVRRSQEQQDGRRVEQQPNHEDEEWPRAKPDICRWRYGRGTANRWNAS